MTSSTIIASQIIISNNFQDDSENNGNYSKYGYLQYEDMLDNVKSMNRIAKKNSNSLTVNSEEVNNKCEKAIKNRIRDNRYALKNRRTVNKDWKDFNNSYY
jgi:nitrogen regulatory protein PII-like uncharacterized protein